jgi:ankyrin repeat protein
MATVFADVRDVNVLHPEFTAPALFFASHRGKLEAVRWLLAQEGIDVNLGDTVGCSPLHVASTYGHEAVVEALITAGADVDHQDRLGRTALMDASTYGHTAIVRRLIAAGARLNHAAGRPWTLHTCAAKPPQ